jgi:CrcB protein
MLCSARSKAVESAITARPTGPMTPTNQVTVVGVVSRDPLEREVSMSRFLWICLGGAVGTGARYLLSGWTLRRFGSLFPWGTLLANLIGCFLISAVMVVGLRTELFSPSVRLVLTMGVLGGFTTYSSFNYETISYFQEGAWLMGFSNLAVVVLGCLAAGVAGLASAQWFLRR